MAQLIARHHYTVLTLLVFLAGCAMPNARSEPTPAVAVTNPSRALPASVFESESHTSPVTAVSQAAYESPAVAPPEPQVAADGPAPLPARVLPDRLQPALATQEAFESSAESLQSTYLADDPADPFSGQAELSVEQLVAAVQARNPSLQAAWAAWHAAAERYPQVVSFDDPMFTGMISPQGIGMDDGGGWMVQASQQVPWAGKRALRGSAAAAEAEAMRGDIADTRLRLAEAARTAFYDYYLARRQTEVNASTQRLLEQFREIARNKYQVNQATEQDILQADVELASLESRRTELARDEQIAMARINTLLHRAAHHALPPPPAETPLPETPPAVDALQQAAVHSRPDLFAQQARIRTERANVALACKEYYPDVNLVAKYDGFMPRRCGPKWALMSMYPCDMPADRRRSVRQRTDCSNVAPSTRTFSTKRATKSSQRLIERPRPNRSSICSRRKFCRRPSGVWTRPSPTTRAAIWTFSACSTLNANSIHSEKCTTRPLLNTIDAWRNWREWWASRRQQLHNLAAPVLHVIPT
ncbi:MAG: TolC family protein [Pirellulaceae bacterium]